MVQEKKDGNVMKGCVNAEGPGAGGIHIGGAITVSTGGAEVG
jgi:hypothetical protein